MILEVFSNLNDSVILWFYDSMRNVEKKISLKVSSLTKTLFSVCVHPCACVCSERWIKGLSHKCDCNPDACPAPEIVLHTQVLLLTEHCRSLSPRIPTAALWRHCPSK